MGARFGVTLLVAASLAGVARAEEAPAPALSLHDEAKELYAEGRYADAVEKLEEAVALDPDAVLLHYNLGLIEEKRGRLEAAIAHYRRCLELERDPTERAAIERIVERLEGARAHGAVAPPAAPSPAPPPPAAPPPPPAAGPSPWVWALGGLGAASLVGAVALAARAASLDPGDEARTHAGMGIDALEADVREAHRLAIGADVLAGLAAASAVAAVVVAFVPREERAIATDLIVSPAGGAVRWRF